MKHEIKTQWKGNMLFNADSMGGSFNIDAAEEVGGTSNGLRPKALMLSSLAGCSGLDIVSLLKKMRAEVKGLEIDVTGELTEEHWNVINYLREYFLKNQIAPMIRRLCKETGCNIKRIYELFPSGPAKGACKLAGLPKPTGCV